jgi:PTS system nitrogen regulatory IIA component
MNIKDFLSPGNVIADLRAADKASVLQDLSRRAAAALNVPSDVIAAEILKRERLGSTGVGDGIAIPHARVPGVQNPFGMLARLKPAIDFEAVDGQPVDLVFLLLAPPSSPTGQLNVLACVARRLRDASTLQGLRGAKDNDALYRRITEDAKAS